MTPHQPRELVIILASGKAHRAPHMPMRSSDGGLEFDNWRRFDSDNGDYGTKPM